MVIKTTIAQEDWAECEEGELNVPVDWETRTGVRCIKEDRICEHIYGSKHEQRRTRKALRISRSISNVFMVETRWCKEVQKFKPVISQDEPCFQHEDIMTDFMLKYWQIWSCDYWFPICTDDGWYAEKQTLANEREAWCVRKDGTPTCSNECLLK